MQKRLTLYSLISSLSKAEKRAFKLYANRQKGEKVYIELFDKLDNKEHFTKSLIDNYSQRSIDSLYENLLKSLNIQSNSIRNQLTEYLNNIGQFFDRKIFAGMKNSIEKGKELAYRYEEFETLLVLLDWEIKYNHLTSDIQKEPLVVPSVCGEHQEIIAKLQNKQAFWGLYSQLDLQIKQKITIRGEEEKTRLEQLISNPLLQKDQNCLSLTSQMLQFKSWAIYYQLINDQKNLLIWNKKLYLFFEENKDMQLAHRSPYISSLTAILSALCRTKHVVSEEWVFYLEVKEQLTQIKAINRREEALLFAINPALLHYYFFSVNADKKEGLKYLKQLKSNFGECRSIISKEDILLYQLNIALVYFKIRAFKKSAQYLDIFFQLHEKTNRKDRLAIAKILNLILHYELGHWKLIEKHALSVRKFLSRSGMLHKTEGKLLTFFSKVAQLQQSKQDRHLCLPLMYQLLDDLEKLAEDPYEKNFQILESTFNWIREKIEEMKKQA